VQDGQILAAVAAEEDGMVDLLEELVAAPTVLGHEESGQAVMRRAFGELGIDPVDVGGGGGGGAAAPPPPPPG
jgi:hypothetical protein